MKLVVGWSCPLTEWSQPTGDADTWVEADLAQRLLISANNNGQVILTYWGLLRARLSLLETFLYFIFNHRDNPNRWGPLVFMTDKAHKVKFVVWRQTVSKWRMRRKNQELWPQGLDSFCNITRFPQYLNKNVIFSFPSSASFVLSISNVPVCVYSSLTSWIIS